MQLKPDTFYFIRKFKPEWAWDNELQVCQTDSLPTHNTYQEDDGRGIGFKVLGHIDNNEYLDQYDLTKYEFIEIPQPEPRVETQA